MFKYFTIENIVDEQISETEGKRAFHLVDELGEKRIVWGTTLLDEDQYPVSIQASKKREHPLIECLFRSEIKEKISIEFTQYNAIFKRDDVDVSEKTIEDLAQEMQSKPFRLGSLIEMKG